MSHWLLDTNLLLRSVDEASEHHEVAVAALLEMAARKDEIYVANQSLFEFWVAASRPVERNGLGLALANINFLIDQFLEDYVNLPDPTSIVEEWRRLVTTYRVSGLKAHDIRLAAYARLHEIPRILTFNVDDFKALSTEIQATSPTHFLSNPDAY